MWTQTRAHIQGNLNVSNDRALLKHLITQLLPRVGYPRRLKNHHAPRAPATKESLLRAAINLRLRPRWRGIHQLIEIFEYKIYGTLKI